jgi:hypothetical protein
MKRVAFHSQSLGYVGGSNFLPLVRALGPKPSLLRNSRAVAFSMTPSLHQTPNMDLSDRVPQIPVIPVAIDTIFAVQTTIFRHTLLSD